MHRGTYVQYTHVITHNVELYLFCTNMPFLNVYMHAYTHIYKFLYIYFSHTHIHTYTYEKERERERERKAVREKEMTKCG